MDIARFTDIVEDVVGSEPEYAVPRKVRADAERLFVESAIADAQALGLQAFCEIDPGPWGRTLAYALLPTTAGSRLDLLLEFPPDVVSLVDTPHTLRSLHSINYYIEEVLVAALGAYFSRLLDRVIDAVWADDQAWAGEA